MNASQLRRDLARAVALAHQPLQTQGLLALLCGSAAEGLADEHSDLDMAITFDRMPAEADLRSACASVGAAPWHWQAGERSEGAFVVALRWRSVEVQIAYSQLDRLQRDLDQLLVHHDPDTPLHKLAEGLLKAQPLLGADVLSGLQRRLAVFPPPLGRAMAAHFLGRVTPWAAVERLLQRDALLWCRQIQLEACWRMLGALAGVNGLYFTTFQFKRMRAFASQLALSPPDLAQRLEFASGADPAAAFAALHALEGEVLAIVGRCWPDLDLRVVHDRWRQFDVMGTP